MRKTSSNGIRAYIELARPSNVLLPALAVVAGFLFTGAELNADLWIGLVAFFLLHSAVTIWNDIEDRAIDKLNNVDTILTRSAKAIPQARKVVVLLVVATLVCGVFLPPSAITWLVVFLVLAWAYNARPLILSRRPISSIVVLGLCYAFVPILLGASLGLGVSSEVVWLAVFWALGRASLSILKDYKDAVGDAKSNKRTFLLVYGNRRVRLVSLILGIVGYVEVARITYELVVPASVEWFYASVGAALLLLVYGRLVLFRKNSYEQLNRVFHMCLQWQLLCDGVIVAWLITL